MKNSHLYSLAKALSWRIIGMFMTVVISFIITHKLNLAVYIGLLEFISKILFFYLHERVWENITLKSTRRYIIID